MRPARNVKFQGTQGIEGGEADRLVEEKERYVLPNADPP